MSNFLTLEGRIINTRHIVSITIRKRPGIGKKKLSDKGGLQLIPDSPASRSDPDVQFTECGFDLMIELMQEGLIKIRKETIDEVNSIFNEIEVILDSKKIRT